MVREKRQRGPTNSAQALSSLAAAVGNDGQFRGQLDWKVGPSLRRSEGFYAAFYCENQARFSTP